jgi:hypothetical protein
MNYDFADKCVKCGFPLTIQCEKCGQTVPTETGLCPQCGADLPLPRKLGAVREREDQVEETFRQGLASLGEQRYQEAKESFEEVLVINPGHIEALYNLGVACAALGLRDDARRHWEQVQQLNPEYPDIQKDLDSLLSPLDRRRMGREKRRGEPLTKKKREQQQKKSPAEGQSLMWEYEQNQEEEKLVPEEETGGFEAFLYVLMVGLVIGVAYALNRPSAVSRLTMDRVILILKQTGVIVIILFIFWIVLGILCRLLSLIFKGKGGMGGYMASSARFLMPFFLLIFPIVLSIPQIVNLLPEVVRPWLKQFPAGSGLESLPPPPWVVLGGLALFLGLFSLARGVSRVGRIALWKGFPVALVALAITVVAVGGLAYLGYTTAENMGYLDMLGLGPETITPTPTSTPPPPAMPTQVPTIAPALAPTP